MNTRNQTKSVAPVGIFERHDIGLRSGVIIITLMFTVASVTVTASERQRDWPFTIGRQFVQADKDIVTGLRDEQRYADIARRSAEILDTVPSDSDIAAHAVVDWTLANVDAARAGKPITDQASLYEPIQRFRQTHPNHPRGLFLDAEEQRCRLRMVEGEILVRLADAPESSSDALARQLVRLSDEVRRLSSAAMDAQSSATSERRDTRDLRRLHRSLIVRRVKVVHLQTLLDTEGSLDAVASSSAVVRAAESALNRLPSSSPAAGELRLLMADALESNRQFDRAIEFIQTLDKRNPNVAAIAIRLAAKTNRLDQAATIFGSIQPPAPATDLAWLDVKLLSADAGDARLTEAIVSWVRTIERRHGNFAARQAESRTLRSFKHVSFGDKDDDRAAGLAAMRATERIRRGEHSEGGQLMVTAAAASTQPSVALSRASVAAAALAKSSPDEAIDVLRATAARFLSHPESVGAAVTAMDLARRHSTDRMPTLVRWFLRDFADSPPAADYRQWLVQYQRERGNVFDAAETSRGEAAMLAWRRLFEQADLDGEFEMVSQRFEQHRSTIPEASEHHRDLRLWAGHFLDLVKLITLRPIDGASSIESYRRHPAVTPPAFAPSNLWRLLRDGRLDRHRRTKIASDLLAGDVDLNQWQQLTLDVWQNRDSQVSSATEEIIAGSPSPQTRERLASILADGSDATRRIAVEQYDRLAAGFPIGDRRWFKAKYDAIKILAEVDAEESFRRVQYILLTAPNLNDQWRRKFESLSDRLSDDRQR